MIGAWRELTRGYTADEAKVLSVTFESDMTDIVALTNVPFASLCQHHLFPFVGNASVGYLPVEGRGRGPQQTGTRDRCVFPAPAAAGEDMTVEIAEAVASALDTPDVGCVIEADHACVACRGVRKSGVRALA